MKIKLSDDKIKNIGLAKFYENVAIESGYKLDGTEKFDCTKIEVAQNIQDEIFTYYETLGTGSLEIGMLWVCSGPKANVNFEDNEVEISDEFVVFEK